MLSIAERRERLRLSTASEFVELLVSAGYDPANHLRFFDWSGADFSGCDLTGCDFTGANLEGCSFAGAKIAGARFDRAVVDRRVLRQAVDWEEHIRRRTEVDRPGSDRHLPELAIFSDGPFAPELVVLPPGEFLIGSEADKLIENEPASP